MRFLIPALLIIDLGLATTSWALPSSQTLFGHQVAVERDAKDMSDVLKVDGKIVHRDAVIDIEETTTVDGVGVAIGSSSAGGNACDASPFVLSFPAKKKPRFDGPLQTCKTVNHQTGEHSVRFETVALEGDDGEAWLWTPASGFKRAGIVKHKPDATRGWDELRAHQTNHPSELLDNGAIAPQLLRLLGADKKAVLPLINGVGSGTFVGDMYVGTACRPHACPDAGVLVIADPDTRHVFVAWKLEGRRIQVRGQTTPWPKAARAELDKWSATWDHRP